MNSWALWATACPYMVQAFISFNSGSYKLGAACFFWSVGNGFLAWSYK